MAKYKIKDLEALTGIKSHTIRIWEKRYNLLEPNRTDTNLRLYSDRDLQDILLVNLLNRNGFKISKIADLNREERIRRASNLDTTESVETGISKLIYALVEMDENAFDQIIKELVDDLGLEKALGEYVFPFLERIGVMWLADTITIAQEHFISMLIRQRLIGEIDKLEFEPDGHFKAALLYLPENEWHELGLLCYHYILKKKNWQIFYLGQSTPIKAVREVCLKKEVNLIVSAWVSHMDTKLVQLHFKHIRSFYQGAIAVGGSHSAMFDGIDAFRIAQINDLSFFADQIKSQI